MSVLLDKYISVLVEMYNVHICFVEKCISVLVEKYISDLVKNYISVLVKMYMSVFVEKYISVLVETTNVVKKTFFQLFSLQSLENNCFQSHG